MSMQKKIFFLVKIFSKQRNDKTQRSDWYLHNRSRYFFIRNAKKIRELPVQSSDRQQTYALSPRFSRDEIDTSNATHVDSRSAFRPPASVAFEFPFIDFQYLRYLRYEIMYVTGHIGLRGDELTDDADLGDWLYANHILRDMGTRHLSDGESRRVSPGPEILYLIAVSHATVLPKGMLLVKSHQNAVKTIYILPYGDRLFSWVLLG